MYAKKEKIFCLLVAMVFLFTNSPVLSVFAENRTDCSNINIEPSDGKNPFAASDTSEELQPLKTKKATVTMADEADENIVSGNQASPSQSDTLKQKEPDAAKASAGERTKLATTTSSGGLLLALKRAVCVRA